MPQYLEPVHGAGEFFAPAVHPQPTAQQAYLIGGASIAMVEQFGFSQLPLTDQQRLRYRHGDLQDSIVTTEEVCAVADGVTSKPDGAAASQIVITTFAEYIRALKPFSVDPDKMESLVSEAAREADAALHRALGTTAATTLTAHVATSDPGTRILYHVGDGRATKIYGQQTTVLSTEQILQDEQSKKWGVTNLFKGQGRPRELLKVGSKQHQYRELFTDQVSRISIGPGDTLMLASDFLGSPHKPQRWLPDRIIASALSVHALTSHLDLERAARSIIEDLPVQIQRTLQDDPHHIISNYLAKGYTPTLDDASIVLFHVPERPALFA